MRKYLPCLFISLSFLLPFASSAAALQKYHIPQQSNDSANQLQEKSNSGFVSEEVYDRFKEKVKDYSTDEKKNLAKHFRNKAKEAELAGDTGAEAYYQRLIGILKIEH